MPGWQREVKGLVESGRLQVAGILQEQHADRALLFHQWQRLDFPLLVDSYNELGVKVVPIHLLLDAAGRVVAVNPQPKELPRLLDELAALSPPNLIDAAPPELTAPTPPGLQVGVPTPSERLKRATVPLVYGAPEDKAIQALRQATQVPSTEAKAWFRLGVALRHRFEDEGDAEDFSAAVEAWRKALALDPNHYIWRRRIQQYGPRLDKPYPFYDWVAQARKDIAARGETPRTLRVEPVGAELTAPLPRKTAEPTLNAHAGVEFPDPKDQVEHDDGLILAKSIVVPDTQGRAAARVHLSFQPHAGRAAHWNNEVEPARVWLQLPEGWSSPTPQLTLSQSAEEVSTETRSVEFELRGAPGASFTDFSAVLFAHVCEGVDGTCVYRRIEVKLRLSSLR